MFINLLKIVKEYIHDMPKILFWVFIAIWIVLAIKPLYRFDWFLENIVIFLSIPLVILSYYKFRLSNFSYLLIFIFAVLHILGAHYTYGDTPWGDWLSQFFGWQRNHYDRLVHFLFGVLMTPVSFDMLKNYLPNSRVMSGLFVFGLIFSAGSLYEVAEFLVGIMIEPEAGLAFLGFQGDIWDTQKDMALQALGILMGFMALISSSFIQRITAKHI